MAEYLFTENGFTPSASEGFSNRGFLYADGFFESLLCINGSPTYWSLRQDRIVAVLNFLRMEPLDLEAIYAGIRTVLSDRSSEIVRARITFFRSGQGRYTPMSNAVTVVLNVEELESDPMLTSQTKTLGVSKTFFDATPANRHKLISKHWQVLAALEAKDAKKDDLVLINQRNGVVEGISSNILLRFGEEIRTPPLEAGCLDGIARRVLLELPQVKEAPVSLNDLEHADAIFMANSIVGVIPMQLEETLPDRKAGIELTSFLRSKIEE
ncbi:MAG: aminotransferase class IV [Cryomorphaceae bacterium]